MDNLTPITREEKLWNGEDLEPLTREKMYIKRIFDKTQTIPDKPLTRKEILMEKAGEGGGGDVAIKQLSVTANGTYSEEGTAYSPVNVAVPLAEKSVTENGVYNASADSVAGYSKVNVNVPLPDNAYLLKEASGSLVSFDDGADLPMPSFICNIDAVQDLHGYDAPWVGGAGKNKYPNLIGEESFTNNVGGSSSHDGGTLIVECTSPNNSGAYSSNDGAIKSYIGTLSGEYTYSFYAKASTALNAKIGFYLFNRPTVSLTTQWQRVVVTATFNGTEDAFTVYGTGTAGTIQIKDLMIEEGSVVHDYAPYSNICPISGHTGVDAWVRGKNLAHLANVTRSGQGIDAVVSNEIISASGTANTTYANLNYFNPLNVEKGKTYTVMLSKAVSHNIVFRFATDTSDTIYKQITVNAGDTRASFVADNNYFQFRLYIGTLTAGTEVNISDLQILVGYGNVESFEPYNPDSQTIQVSWQTEAGEVFGGYVDLVSGVLTVDRMGVTYSDTNKKRDDGSFRLYPAPSNALVTNVDNEQPSPLFICNKFKFMSIFEVITTSAVNVGIGISKTSNGFYIKDTAMLQMTLEEAKTYLSSHPIDVVYPLAEAQTYQLTPTQIKSLLGNNNAWCDTGNVDIDYFAKEVTG